jgi:hypothetical protein
MKKLWQTVYKPKSIDLPPPCVTLTESTNAFTSYQEKQRARALAQSLQGQPDGDEYDRYCKVVIAYVDKNDPIAWWMQETQRRDYPNLSKMAINILSIPAMSADVERLFSSSGLTLSNRRNRMSTEMLEALECLKSWLKIKDIGYTLEEHIDDE